MLNKQPLVYIILVNYKGLEDTIECLKSLDSITYTNYRTIVVDNASNDNSCEELRKYTNIELIELKENLGFAGGNNVGIKVAMDNKADYVLLLNNDTVVEKDFLDHLVDVAEADSTVGAVGGKIYYFDDKKLIWYAGAKINTFTSRTQHLGAEEHDNGQYNELCETGYITGCMMLVKAEVVEKVGVMDESYFLYYEETDWNVRINQAGYKLMYQPKSVIYHKVSSSTKKINYVMNYYYDRNSYYFINKNYGAANKAFMYLYKRTYLLAKYAQATLQKNEEKKEMVVKAYKSILSKEMGKYNG